MTINYQEFNRRELKSGDEKRIAAIFLEPHGNQTSIIIDGERCCVKQTPADLVEKMKAANLELFNTSIAGNRHGSRVEAGEKIALNLKAVYVCGPKDYPAQSSPGTFVTIGYTTEQDSAFYINTPFRDFPLTRAFESALAKEQENLLRSKTPQHGLG